MHNCTGTHDAGFQRDVQGAARQPVVAKMRSGLSQRHHLGVGRWIMLPNGPVISRADDLAIANHDRSHRNLAGSGGEVSCLDRKAHEMDVVHGGIIASASRDFALGRASPPCSRLKCVKLLYLSFTLTATTMDIVAKRRAREFTLLMLVSGMALIANLPERVLAMVDLDRSVIMAVLGVVVLIAVFLYVRMFFFLFYLLLAVGANLPEQWAEALNISQGPLLAALITMVAISLVNYSAKVLPTGLEKRPKRANPEALQALLSAVDRGNPTHVRAVLSLDFDVNGVGPDGLTPLMHVVQRGNIEIFNMLVAHGADLCMKGPQGTVAEMAVKAGRHDLAKQIEERLNAMQPQSTEQLVIS